MRNNLRLSPAGTGSDGVEAASAKSAFAGAEAVGPAGTESASSDASRDAGADEERLSIDFLAEPFQSPGGIFRRGNEFLVSREWAKMSMPRRRLRSGWWRLECEGEGDLSGVEVRLRNSSDPYIAFGAAAAGAERIYLQGSGTYDISVMVSAWPCRVRMRKFRLARLSLLETLTLMRAGVGKVLRNPNPVRLIGQLLQRISAGQALGVNVRAASPAEALPQAVAGDGRRAGPAIIRAWPGVVAALGQEDRLDPRAQQVVADAFARDARLQAVYCDVRSGGRVVPIHAWDAELARWNDFVGLPVFFRAAAWRESEPVWPQLVALAAKSTAAVGRIALPLVERPASADPVLAPPPAPLLASVPPVSVILPTKLRLDLLEACLKGLADKTGYPELEVILVDNGCDPVRLAQVLEGVRPRLRIKKVVDNGAFNFSRLINAGVGSASGEVILVLNDDVEPIGPGWVHRMVAAVQESDVGAVGARLIYPDGSIQHAGVVLGLGGVCGHLRKGTTPEEATRVPQIMYSGERMAVTGACLAVRRDVFDKAGGFDEAFPVAFNDIDFCLRLRAAGYRNIYCGDAILIHRESQSRQADDVSVVSRRRLAIETDRFLARWSAIVDDDPFGSPALDPGNERGVAHRVLQSPAQATVEPQVGPRRA